MTSSSTPNALAALAARSNLQANQDANKEANSPPPVVSGSVRDGVSESTNTLVKKDPARLFKSHHPSNTFLMENGKPCIFRLGRYVTEDRREIYELERECHNGNPVIYMDPNEMTVEPEVSVAEMMEQIRKDAYAQALRDIQGGRAQVGDSTAIKGGGILTTEQTQDIAQGAGGSVGTSDSK